MACDYRCRCVCACFNIVGRLLDSSGNNWSIIRPDDSKDHIVDMKASVGGKFSQNNNCGCALLGHAKLQRTDTIGTDTPIYSSLAIDIIIYGSGYLYAETSFGGYTWKGGGKINLKCMPDCMQWVNGIQWREIPDPSEGSGSEPPELGDPVNVADRFGHRPGIILQNDSDSEGSELKLIMMDNECCKAQCIAVNVIIPPDGPVVWDDNCGDCPGYFKMEAWWWKNEILGARICEADDPPKDDCDITTYRYLQHYQRRLHLSRFSGDRNWCSPTALHLLRPGKSEENLNSWWQVKKIEWSDDPVKICEECARSYGGVVWKLTFDCKEYYSCVTDGSQPGDPEFPSPKICMDIPCTDEGDDSQDEDSVEFYTYDSVTGQIGQQISKEQTCHNLGEEPNLPEGDKILVRVAWKKAMSYGNPNDAYDYRNGLPVCKTESEILWVTEYSDFVGPKSPTARYSFEQYDCPKCAIQKCQTIAYDTYPYHEWPFTIYEGVPSLKSSSFIIEGSDCEAAVNNAISKRNEIYNINHSYYWAPDCYFCYPKAHDCEIGIRNCTKHAPDANHPSEWYTVELYFCYICWYGHKFKCGGPRDDAIGLSFNANSPEEAVNLGIDIFNKYKGQSPCDEWNFNFLCDGYGSYDGRFDIWALGIAIGNCDYGYACQRKCCRIAGRRGTCDSLCSSGGTYQCYCKLIENKYSNCANDISCYRMLDLCPGDVHMHPIANRGWDPRYSSSQFVLHLCAVRFDGNSAFVRMNIDGKDQAWYRPGEEPDNWNTYPKSLISGWYKPYYYTINVGSYHTKFRRDYRICGPNWDESFFDAENKFFVTTFRRDCMGADMDYTVYYRTTCDIECNPTAPRRQYYSSGFGYRDDYCGWSGTGPDGSHIDWGWHNNEHNCGCGSHGCHCPGDGVCNSCDCEGDANSCDCEDSTGDCDSCLAAWERVYNEVISIRQQNLVDAYPNIQFCGEDLHSPSDVDACTCYEGGSWPGGWSCTSIGCKASALLCYY